MIDDSYAKTAVSNSLTFLTVYDTYYIIHNVLRVHKLGFAIHKTVTKT